MGDEPDRSEAWNENDDGVSPDDPDPSGLTPPRDRRFVTPRPRPLPRGRTPPVFHRSVATAPAVARPLVGRSLIREFTPSRGHILPRYSEDPNRLLHPRRLEWSSDPARLLHPALPFPNFPGAAPVSSIDSAMFKRSRKTVAPIATSSSVSFTGAERRLTLTGREYVTTLTTPTYTAAATSAFSTTSSLLRPTDTQLFSWLSGIAKKFEEFKFHSLVFTYEPQCATTTTGSVALWFDGDPTHAPPSNWNNVINTGSNVHGAPWAKHVFRVPPHLFAARTTYYTSPEFNDANKQPLNYQGAATPTDPLEYYPGIYGFASQDVGIAAAPWNIALGKVYLDYSISFKVQNTDSFTMTSAYSRYSLSQENTENGSGTYDVVAGTSIAVAATALALDDTANGCLIMGALAGTNSVAPLPQELMRTGALCVTHGGTKYFNFIGSPTTAGLNSWIARGTLELKLTLQCRLAAADCTSIQIGIIPFDSTTAITGTWTVNRDPAAVVPANAGGAANTSAALGYVGAVRGMLALMQAGITNSQTIVGSQYPILVAELKLSQGDQLYVVVRGGGTLSGFQASFSPYTFGSWR